MVRFVVWGQERLETPAEQALLTEYDKLLEELDRQDQQEDPQQEAPPDEGSSDASDQSAPVRDV